ncbi:MAG: DUF6069 family protein [Flavobacteriales bacterium]|jgi:hypothetical protein
MNTKLSFKQIITAGAIAAVCSMIINALLFFTFHGAGVLSDSILIQPGQPLTVVPIIMASMVPSLIGASIFFFFEKYSANGFKIFSIISIVLLILSFANPFMGIPNVTIGYGIVLNVMHVVVAFSLLFFLKRAKK